MKRLPLLIGIVCLTAAAVVLLLAALGDDGVVVTDSATIDEMIDLAGDTEAADAPETDTALQADTDTDFPAIQDSAIRDPEDRSAPQVASLTVVEQLAHDTAAFTQGLEFDGDRLFESTGLVGQSSLREIDPETGAVLRQIPVPEVFAEGLTVVGDEIIQITWTEGVAYRWDRDSFELLETHEYDGQGWGICDDGDVLRMSDGTPTLTTRDVDTFEVLDTVTVTFNGVPVERINELECVGGTVWANVWLTPLVIQIDPETGVVLTVLDASELRPESTEGDSGAVLNGIAWDAETETFLLGGKRWPITYRVLID